jgi:hypothetical protein
VEWPICGPAHPSFLPGAVLHDERHTNILDSPGRREEANILSTTPIFFGLAFYYRRFRLHD